VFDHQLAIGVASTLIGMNLWSTPHSSEHWPKKKPGWLIENIIWFNRPGMASTFKPREGIAQE
jgi:hypothetical protein